MTEVSFRLNADRKITGFTSSGHAGYRKKGQDIVCSAISVLVITAENALEEVAGADVDTRADEKEGRISVDLRSDPDEKTETIFRSLELGLRGVSAEYGGRYCKVTIEEEKPC